jgi:hypothetical protein
MEKFNDDEFFFLHGTTFYNILNYIEILSYTVAIVFLSLLLLISVTIAYYKKSLFIQIKKAFNGIINRCNKVLPSPIVIILLSLLLISVVIVISFMTLLCFLILYINFYQFNRTVVSINPFYSFIEVSYHTIFIFLMHYLLLIDLISDIIVEMIYNGYGLIITTILFSICCMIYFPTYFFSRKLYKSAISKDD